MPPDAAILEYAHLTELQFGGDAEAAECEESTSLLRLPAVGEFAERRCLRNLDIMLGQFVRYCSAIATMRQE